jgi:hypothetical protein
MSAFGSEADATAPHRVGPLSARSGPRLSSRARLGSLNQSTSPKLGGDVMGGRFCLSFLLGAVVAELAILPAFAGGRREQLPPGHLRRLPIGHLRGRPVSIIATISLRRQHRRTSARTRHPAEFILLHPAVPAGLTHAQELEVKERLIQSSIPVATEVVSRCISSGL